MENSYLSEDDVISVSNRNINAKLGMPPTFCAKEVEEKIRGMVLKETGYDIALTFEGKFLQCDQPGWRAGKMKIKVLVEFVEDEPVKKKLINNANTSGILDHLRSLDVEQAEN